MGFNKEEIIKIIKIIDLPQDNSWWICSSGSLVLQDVINTAGDIDIVVNEQLYHNLNKKFTLNLSKDKKEFSTYITNELEDVEFVLSKIPPSETIVLDLSGIQTYCERIENIRKNKIRRGLQKDLDHIKAIDNYLKKFS